MDELEAAAAARRSGDAAEASSEAKLRALQVRHHMKTDPICSSNRCSTDPALVGRPFT